MSVVISALNEAARIQTCLKSLARQQTDFDFEVIVVDNNSTDETFTLASAEAQADSRFQIYQQKKKGSPAARNLGAQKAKGEILVFTDADCRPSPQWLQEIIRPFREESRLPLAAVGGHTKSLLHKPSKAEKLADQIFREWEAESISANPGFLPWAPTCNLAVKKSVFKQIGGFEESWQKAAYDVDLCWRILLCGYTLTHAPQAIVYHQRRTTMPELWQQLKQYGYYNSQLLRTYEIVFTHSAGLERWKRQWEWRKNRAIAQMRRWLKAWKNPSEFYLLAFSEAALGFGKWQAWRKPISLENKLAQNSRSGKISTNPPAPYRFLQNHGWCYWPQGENLVLFHPSHESNLELNPTAWTIWEAKSMGVDNETLIGLLRAKKQKKKVLREVDEFALQLRRAGVPL